MKHIMLLKKVLIILLITTISMSCGSDDDTINTSGSIEGTWELTALSYKTQVGPTVASSIGKDIDNVLLNINSDGSTSGNGKTFTVETSIAGGTGTNSTESELILNEGEWHRDGNTFTWTGQGDSRDFTIRQLSATSLHLTGDYGDEMAFDLFNSIDLKFARKN
ncbi:hypothetical protein [Sinomicrobium sp.]